MHQPTFSVRLLRAIGALICLGLTLAACEIEGGVPATPVAAPTMSQPPTSAAVVEAIAAREDTWAIGLMDAPQDLYPYATNAPAQRIAAPVMELLYPSPILSFNYGYTTTGVLERIPTIENGGVEVRKADVFLDAAGNITTTTTDVMTQVEQLVVTFNWNPRLRWSDGQPVTADDSVFAYELAKAAPPGDDARDRLMQLVGYEKVDDHTTRAILRPDFTGPTYFLNYWTPLPRHKLTGIPPDKVRESEFARAPIGYGPYAIESRNAGEIRMVRNQHYFGATQPGAPSKLVISFVADLERLRAGVLNDNLDVVAVDRPQVEQFAVLEEDARAGRAQVTYTPNPIWEHIDFNLDVPLLQDIRIRRAVAFGTNRQAMADALFHGRSPVLESWVLPGQAEAAPPDQLTRYPYSQDEARRLLDEVGYTDPEGDGVRVSTDGVTLTLQLMTTDRSPIRQEITRRFQADMQAIGVKVDVLSLATEDFFDPNGPLFQRQFELALFGWIHGPDPGGLQLWSCRAVPSGDNGWTGENFSGWCFRDANQAIREAVTTLDLQRRKDAYLRQQQLWTQELPSLPLFQRLSMTIVVPGVSGTQPDPLAPITWNIASWRRER